MKAVYIPLQNRSVIEIIGNNRIDFLQGIITNDIEKVSQENTIYACLLTPQGKYLADFFISELGGSFLLDCDSSLKDGLIKRLTMYKLRSNVTIKDISDEFEVAALLGDKVFEQDNLDDTAGKTMKFCKGIAYIDPRTTSMFGRSVIERENEYKSFEAKKFSLGKFDQYEELRISLIVPETNKELIPEKSFPLQNRMEEMNAIDFEKGCYVGQEVTARSKHRGKIRKTLFTGNANDEHKGIITSSFGDHVIIFGEKEAS